MNSVSYLNYKNDCKMQLNLAKNNKEPKKHVKVEVTV